MTIDELLQQLMKIKEVYPDSGKFLVKTYNSNGELLPIERLMKLYNTDMIVSCKED